MAPAELDLLIDGYADGLLDEVATGRLAAVLRGDPAARRRYWERQRLHAQLGALAHAATGSARALTPARRPGWRWRRWATAAALAAALAGAWLGWPGDDLPRGLGAGSALAGRRELVWSDGTRVRLEADARAVVLDAWRGPALRLESGGLSAAVAPHGAAHPFAIATPEATATVIGTAFRLATGDGTTALAVEHGRVRLANAAGAVEAGGGSSALAAAGAAPHLVGRIRAVAPEGDDAAAGDPAHPWRSLGRASAALEPADTLVVRGTWRETLVLDRPGRFAGPITIRGEGAVLDGTEPLAGWIRRADGLWRAQAPWTLASAAEPVGADQLFIDGEPAAFAAWPDAPGLAIASAGAVLGAGTGERSLARARFAAAGLPDGDLTGAVLWWQAADGATPDCGRLVRRTGDGIEFLCRWRPDDIVHRPSSLCRFRILGVAALADRPGEWCRDGSGGVLLRLAEDDAPGRHRIALQRRRAGLDLRAGHLRISGLALVGCGLVGDPDDVGRAIMLRHPRSTLWPERTQGGLPP